MYNYVENDVILQEEEEKKLVTQHYGIHNMTTGINTQYRVFKYTPVPVFLSCLLFCFTQDVVYKIT